MLRKNSTTRRTGSISMNKKPKHYINNTDLLNAIVAWQESCKVAVKKGEQTPIIPDYIGKCIMDICERLSHRYNFNNYSYRDEMVPDGIEACINAVKNFDIKKTDRAFAYLTMVAFRAFQRRILTERKQQYIKHKNYQHMYLIDDFEGGEINDNEHSNKVIGEYEEKHLTKPKKSDKMGKIDVFTKKKVKI